MARLLSIRTSQAIIFTLLASFTMIQATLDCKLHGLKKQKLSHFHVYWHDILRQPQPTAVYTVQPPDNTSATSFGYIIVVDAPLTEGPELSSKMIARAQGYYGSASQQEFGLWMSINIVFLEGKYNGSTIAIQGRNRIFSTSEMPVIGGSGVFRFATGYVQLKTHSINQTIGDTVVEYDIYVLHH